MTTWYIKTGELGGGTSAEDYAGSWADIDASLADGDTVYIHGASVLREQIAFTGSNLTLAAQPGTGRWTQTGRRLAAASGWLVHSGGLFGRTVYKYATGESVAGLVYDYRLGTAEGVPELYVGHLPQSAEATLIDFVADIGGNDRPSWFYDSGTLYAYFPGNADPRSSGKAAEWLATMTAHGLHADACAGLSLSGGRIDCWWDNAGSYAGLALTGCTYCTVEDMEFGDCAYHSAGCTGGACRGNVFKNLVCLTARRGTQGHVVQSAGSGETLSGGLFEDCTLHLAGSRDYNGDPLETSGSLRGVAGHADGAIAAGSGLVFRRITTVRYADEESAGGAASVVHAGGGAAPADAGSPASYPILHEDCVYQDYAAVSLSASDSHAAFRRCRFATDGRSATGMIFNGAVSVASGCKGLFESCAFAAEMLGTTNHVVFRVLGALRLSNCSVRAAGATDAVFFGGLAADLDCVHSLFVASSSGRLCRGGTMPPPVFARCWYDAGFGDATFGAAAAFNTQAEWAAGIDPDGVYDADFSAAFTDADTLEPDPASAVWTARDIGANPARPAGVNGRPYAGNVGAWQAARPAGGRSRARNWRDR